MLIYFNTAGRAFLTNAATLARSFFPRQISGLREFTKTKRQRHLPLFDDVEEMLKNIPKVLKCDLCLR
jgi:hypothetical protein